MLNVKNKTLKKTPGLTTFKYTGYNQKGYKIHGETKAKSLSAAKAFLKAEGITVKKISKLRKPIFNNKAIKQKDITAFTRQLATLISSGVPLIQGLDICMRANENALTNNMINQIKTSVEHGHSLSEAMALFPDQFNNLYRNLLAVGESSGTLDEMLIRLANHQERMQHLKSKFKKALIYPVSIIIVSILVTTILLIYVVPQFESMFDNFNAELPWFTQTILDFSRWFQKYWYYILLSTIIIFSLLYKSFKNNSNKALKTFIDKFILNIPIIGGIINKICLARFARTLNTMLSSGLPLLNSLPATATVIDNEIYSNAIGQIKEEIESGQSFNMALQNSECFNNMIVQMVAIGESSGTLDQMLLKLAEHYEENIDNTIDNLSSILEPIIILLLSVIVGGLIVAMYLPIFSIGALV